MADDPRALELYARGLVNTRDQAARLVAADPEGVQRMLAFVKGPEMLHPDDRASFEEWGGVG